MQIDGQEYHDQSCSMFIWISAQTPNMAPSLSLDIRADHQQGLLKRKRFQITPCIHFEWAASIRDWQSLVGLAFGNRPGDLSGGQLFAWCLDPQMAETEQFSLVLLDRDKDFFTVETKATVRMHDVGWRPYIAEFHSLAKVRFLGIHVGLLGDATDPAIQARQLVEPKFETKYLMPPVVHERRIEPSGPIAAYEVHFLPLIVD